MIIPEVSTKHQWNNCFSENNQEILLDFVDFILQKRAGDDLMVAVFLVNWFKADITCVLANQDCEIALSNDHYH